MLDFLETHTFQGSVKQKGPRSDEGVACKCDEEDAIMAVFEAADDSLDGKVDEQKIGQSVNYFGAIQRGIVVLLTPLQSSGARKKIAFALMRDRVSYGWKPSKHIHEIVGSIR